MQVGKRVRILFATLPPREVEQARTGTPVVQCFVCTRHPQSTKSLGGAETIAYRSRTIFKDSYLLDFLALPERHSEADLQKGLVANRRRFLLELGRDFCFIGEQYLVQVGNKDFRLDLLLYHRELQCLVDFELKIDDFKPEYLRQLEFYLEALDRDVRKPHERPSIGVLLCASKDAEVVEYALSRSLSPALIAEYQLRLPDKKLLQTKLQEFYELVQAQLADAPPPTKARPSRKKTGKEGTR